MINMNSFVSNDIGGIETFAKINDNYYFGSKKGSTEWKTDTYKIECNIKELNCNIFDSCSLDGAYSIKWCIYAYKVMPYLILTTKFNPKVKVEFDNDSGENRDGIYITKDKFHLAIGTEDSDCLFNRSMHEDNIPKRISNWFECDENLKNKSNSWTKDNMGLEIAIPSLLEGESVSIKFGAAWKSNVNKEWELYVSLGSEM